MLRVARLTYPGTERQLGFCVYNDTSAMLYRWIFPQMFVEELGAVLYALILRDKAPHWAEADVIAYADSVREFMLARFGEAPEEMDEYWKILAESPEMPSEECRETQGEDDSIYGQFLQFRYNKVKA